MAVVVVKPFHASEFSFIVSLSGLFLLCCPPLSFLPFALCFLLLLLLAGLVVFPRRGAHLAFLNQGWALGAAGTSPGQGRGRGWGS